ncbi:MAG: tRNA (N6-isopentenyl adenosine(37)-C2)-methylthiotransferase MiaB [Candidatus Neomarinimicrobiota bacterium]
METIQTVINQDLRSTVKSDKTYFIETYGCQMNAADSELVESILQNIGYSPAENIYQAKAIFVNTCAIRDHAEEKVNSQLGRYDLIKKKTPEVIIGVLGCMAQSLKHDILENKPYVDIIIGPDSYRKLPEILNRKNINNNIIDTNLSRFEVYDDLFPKRKNGVNAWVSIMRGCDKFCTFCIVPFTRGRERSRDLNGILTEVEKAVDDGYSEITLLGQNVNSYKNKNNKFHNLLEQVSKINGLKRIRYTSPHPKDMSEKVINIMNKYDNICNSVHLPLQAGSDRILKRMNRTYTKKEFIILAHQIQNKLPNVGISTDIIVGFPGETNSDFEQTLEVMNSIKFDFAFNFKYSARRGTKAIEYDDQINEEDKKSRLARVIALQKEHTLFRNKKLIGSFQKVLIEKESKLSSSNWAGRTDSNKWVIFDKGKSRIGELVNVKINEAVGVTLKGQINYNA